MFDTERAACRRRSDIPLKAWFPEDSGAPDDLLRICATCPILDTCFNYAMADKTVIGIWGGTSAQQREKLRSGKNRLTCPVCRAKNVWTADGDQVCAACGVTWRLKAAVVRR